MNPNVGKLYNGYPILDADSFESVKNALKSDPLVNAEGTQYVNFMVFTGAPESSGLDASGAFSLSNFNSGGYGTGEYTDGNEPGSRPTTDLGALGAAYKNAVNSPNAIFVWDGPQVNARDKDKDRVRVYYYRIKNIVVPIAANTYYSASNWVDTRGGLIFVVGVIFSALGAPVISSAVSAMASGAEVGVAVTTAAETGATASSAVGAASSAAGQVLQNPLIGAAGKVFNLASGQTGAGTMDELDFAGSGEVDFTKAFDPVDYSSGESLTAFSDASNVDFGFGAVAPTDSALVIGPEVYDFGGGTGAAYDFNATAESNTSDYGSSSQGNPDFDTSNFKGLSSGINVAQQVAKATQANNSVTQTATRSGGGQKYSQTMAGIGSVLSQASSPSQGSAPVLTQLVGLVKQLESSAPRTYAGQLGGNKTSPSMGNNNMLLIGGALVAVALFMHFKG